MDKTQQSPDQPAVVPTRDSRFIPCPTVMTEQELIQFLRIPEISNATDYRHVIENLKRAHGLPRVHLCGKAVYLTDSVKAWLEKHVVCGQ